MAASVVAVTLYTVALLVFGLGYAVVFFTGKVCYNISKSWVQGCEKILFSRIRSHRLVGSIHMDTPHLRFKKSTLHSWENHVRLPHQDLLSRGSRHPRVVHHRHRRHFLESVRRLCGGN